jgi:hypothetical protein
MVPCSRRLPGGRIRSCVSSSSEKCFKRSCTGLTIVRHRPLRGGLRLADAEILPCHSIGIEVTLIWLRMFMQGLYLGFLACHVSLLSALANAEVPELYERTWMVRLESDVPPQRPAVIRSKVAHRCAVERH